MSKDIRLDVEWHFSDANAQKVNGVDQVWCESIGVADNIDKVCEAIEKTGRAVDKIQIFQHKGTVLWSEEA